MAESARIVLIVAAVLIGGLVTTAGAGFSSLEPDYKVKQ